MKALSFHLYLRSILAVSLLTLAWGTVGVAQTTYTITDLGTLGGTYSEGKGINASGQVTGFSYTSGDVAPHAFLYSNGNMSDLGTLGGRSTYSLGLGVNASGQVTGRGGDANANVAHAFLYSDGTFNDLGTLTGDLLTHLVGTYPAEGRGINASGQVTGYATILRTTDNHSFSHAFLYSNGTMIDLVPFSFTGKYDGDNQSDGSAINTLGQITGGINDTDGSYHAFLYSNGIMKDLGNLGGTYNDGLGVNDSGQITGIASTSGGNRAFLYSGGTMTNLGTLGGSYSQGNSVNASGQAVGVATTSTGEQHAFLYNSGTGMIDLNAVLPGGSGWILIRANGINDIGQITGYGTNPSGSTHAFLLFPVASPSFLSFPLPNKTAFTAAINTVFDHSSVGNYCANPNQALRAVTAYTGEQGFQPYFSQAYFKFTCSRTPNKLYGFANGSGKPFMVNGHYAGGGDPNFLYYEGHPGYDYRTKDQNQNGTLCSSYPQPCNATGKTPVLAAAIGTVVCVGSTAAAGYSCGEGGSTYGEVKIDHGTGNGNGYSTVYLHLSKALVKIGDVVAAGQQIGISGDTGPGVTGNPHLHFEVRRNDGNVPVDPYGWQGCSGCDPYTRAVSINLWK
jgi:probable HAF family extracellular repeat protein